jgi:hypothetical protein
MPTFLERASMGLMAGLMVGPLIAVGSRGVMRILALAGHRELQFTWRGNLEILATVVAANALGGVLFVFVRPYLPLSGPLRGLAFGLGLLATLGVVYFIAEHAFGELAIAGPTLSISLFSLLFLAYGVLLELAVAFLQAHPLPPGTSG